MGVTLKKGYDSFKGEYPNVKLGQLGLKNYVLRTLASDIMCIGSSVGAPTIKTYIKSGRLVIH